MLPIRLERILVEKIWGGKNLEDLNINLPKGLNVGESWEIAAHKTHTNKMDKSIINDICSLDDSTLEEVVNRYQEILNYNLQEILELYKGEFLGYDIYQETGNKLPLLVKYLDINDKLSIQVHPNDEYALKNENDLGKTECWYIMDASEDAELVIGVAQGVTKSKFIEKTKKNDFSELFNKIKVKKGDFIFILPGVVHATLNGRVLICEVQQNSDTTYRIYDFDRLENGKRRELHLEKAYDVIDFNYMYNESCNYKIRSIESGRITEFVKCNYFSAELIELNGEFYETHKNFLVFSILEGQGKLWINDKVYIRIKKGDTYLLPANCKIKVEGKLNILKSYVK